MQQKQRALLEKLKVLLILSLSSGRFPMLKTRELT